MSYPMHPVKFSKARLLNELRDRWIEIKNLNKFNPHTGTAQFNNVPFGPERDEKFRKYGEWRGLETLIEMIDDGQLGVHPDTRKLSSIQLTDVVSQTQILENFTRRPIGIHTVTADGELYSRIAPRDTDRSLSCTRLGVVVMDEGEWIPAKGAK